MGPKKKSFKLEKHLLPQGELEQQVFIKSIFKFVVQ